MENQKASLIYSKQQVGARGEAMICSQLIKQGFCILAKNFKIRGGEIDIIARQKNLICCIEVKTRMNNYFHTSQVITPTKQQHIMRAAHIFLMRNYINPENIILRFDVALVYYTYESKTKINYIKNAFTQEYM